MGDFFNFLIFSSKKSKNFLRKKNPDPEIFPGSMSAKENAPGPDLGDGPRTRARGRKLLEEVVGRKFGEGVVHDGLDQLRDLFPDLRLDLVDDELTVLVDELVDGVGQCRKFPVEEVLQADVGAPDVEVDVGVQDAELLVARGAHRHDGG